MALQGDWRSLMNNTKSDHRETRRLRLRIPLHLRVCGSIGPDWAAESVDLSERGVLLKTELSLQVGTEIELHLETADQIIGLPKTDWRCIGRVVHVQQDTSSKGRLVAGVHFSRLQILRASNCS
jgi:hypothetical protein